MKFIKIFLGLFIVSAIFFTACSHPDTTKVTIYFAKNGQASLEQQKLPLIDRLLNFFSSKAYAQIHHPSDTTYYELFVFAEDFDGAFAFAPGNATSVSIEVPSGNNRIFLLYSISPTDEINYAGQVVTDLSGGNASFTINMYPSLIDIGVVSIPGNNFITVTWTYDTATLSGFSNVNIYRACLGGSCDGTFTLLASPLLSAGSYTDIDNDGSNDLVYLNLYYYFIRINTGVFGGGGMPVPISLESYYSDYYYFILFYTMNGTVYNPPI